MTRKISVNRLLSSESGTSGIEFALTVPIIILLFLGGTTLYDLLRAYNRIVEANGIVADVVARQMTMDDALFSKTYGTFASLQADTAMPNALRVTSIIWKNGKYTVDWTKKAGATALLPEQKLDASTLPTIPSGDSIIFVEGVTQYTALAELFGFGTVTYSENAFTRPRFTATVKGS